MCLPLIKSISYVGSEQKISILKQNIAKKHNCDTASMCVQCPFKNKNINLSERYFKDRYIIKKNVNEIIIV